jgi:hypothetical protein
VKINNASLNELFTVRWPRAEMATDPSFRTWTPEVYETLHTTLVRLSEGIETPLNQLSDLLDSCFPIFNNVLQNPAPSEDDRKKLCAGMLYLVWV